MPSTREIRRRIRSIRNTSQITKAMQMVAASKMRRAQQAAINARPFARLLYRLQRRAASRGVDFIHPLMERRTVAKRLVILVSSDKGLCGALNSNVFRMAARYDPATTSFITAGRKAAQFIARTRRTLVAEFQYGDVPKFAEARAMAAAARQAFLDGEADEVIIVATRFINTLTQQAVAIEYLPVGAITGLTMPGQLSEETLTADRDEYLFEPGPHAVLSYLLGHYLNILVYVTLINAKASEQSARMVSMKSATDNAATMIADLTLTYNKLRQGHITQELLEIAGGEAG